MLCRFQKTASSFPSLLATHVPLNNPVSPSNKPSFCLTWLYFVLLDRGVGWSLRALGFLGLSSLIHRKEELEKMVSKALPSCRVYFIIIAIMPGARLGTGDVAVLALAPKHNATEIQAIQAVLIIESVCLPPPKAHLVRKGVAWLDIASPAFCNCWHQTGFFGLYLPGT